MVLFNTGVRRTGTVKVAGWTRTNQRTAATARRRLKRHLVKPQRRPRKEILGWKSLSADS